MSSVIHVSGIARDATVRAVTGEARVAVVTGASRGIGKQTCLQLARHGMQLALAARTEQPRPQTPGTLGETVAALREIGCEPLAIRADLADPGDVDRVVSETLDRFGGVDVLVNNAGYTVGRTLFTHVPDLTREQWDKHFAVNVTAPLMLIQGFWDSMCARGGGVIVNVTSGEASLRSVEPNAASGSGLPENGPAYGSSKAALNRMTNVIAQEGFEHRIAVLALDPGFVLTETMAATFAASGVTETTAIPPAVPAAAIAYLCTGDGAMRYTGEIVDGPALVAELGL
jgi:NAD(P)-dependent dehydrogenase (short-subunit alcohol dehydrogenase family)